MCNPTGEPARHTPRTPGILPQTTPIGRNPSRPNTRSASVGARATPLTREEQFRRVVQNAQESARLQKDVHDVQPIPTTGSPREVKDNQHTMEVVNQRMDALKEQFETQMTRINNLLQADLPLKNDWPPRAKPRDRAPANTGRTGARGRSNAARNARNQRRLRIELQLDHTDLCFATKLQRHRRQAKMSHL